MTYDIVELSFTILLGTLPSSHSPIDPKKKKEVPGSFTIANEQVPWFLYLAGGKRLGSESVYVIGWFVQVYTHRNIKWYVCRWNAVVPLGNGVDSFSIDLATNKTVEDLERAMDLEMIQSPANRILELVCYLTEARRFRYQFPNKLIKPPNYYYSRWGLSRIRRREGAISFSLTFANDRALVRP